MRKLIAMSSSVLLFAGAPSLSQSINVVNISPYQATADAAEPNSASGGRVNRLAVSATNPSLYYAASEYGGLFSSSDGGDTWQKVPDFLHSYMWDVAIHPTDPTRVVATTHYDGRVRSLSGIAVRVQTSPTSVRWRYPDTARPPAGFSCRFSRNDSPSAFGVAFDPDSPDDVYVGTNCGLAISNDAGLTWRFVDPTPADPANDVWDVIVHNGGIIDICGDDGHHRSTDGGITFTTASAAGLPLWSGQCTLAVSPHESYVLYATSGTSIIETTDGGENWNINYTNPFRQGRIPIVKTNSRSATTYDLWFGDISLGRTTCTTPATPAPGGSRRCNPTITGSFTRAAGGHDDVGDVAFDPTAATDACPRLLSSDGGVYVNTITTSPGCHSPAWEQPSQTPRALWLWDMAGADRIRAESEDLYFGTQDNGPFGTQDAPDNSPDWKSEECCDVFDVEATSGQSLFSLCCYREGRTTRLHVADRDLASVREISAYPPNVLTGFQDMETLQATPDGYALLTSDFFGADVYFTRRVDASIAWTQLGVAPARLCSIQNTRAPDPADPGGTRDAFVGKTRAPSSACNFTAAGQLWRYSGNTPGGTWSRINPPGVDGGFGIYAVNPQDADHIIASYLRPRLDPQMVMTRDGGLTWVNLPNLDRLMTGSGEFNYRVDFGRFGFGQFRSYPQPALLAFDDRDPRNVVAGATDAGVFLNTSGGADSGWFNLRDSRFPNIRMTRPKFAYFDSNGLFGRTNVYIGTRGNGVFRVTYEPISRP